MSEFQQLNGPDWLDALAQEATAQGLAVNASEYSRRADQWRADHHALNFARSVVDSIGRADDNKKRNAAHAYDLLSRVRPDEDGLEAYERARITLSALGDVPFGPPVWGDRVDAFGRNPRKMPMPGDRYYLPVEVRAASYKDNGMSVTYVPMLRSQSGHLEPKREHAFCVLGCPTWSLGAIGVVSSPRAAFEECLLAHVAEALASEAAQDISEQAA